jgi:hypothetical protein
LLDGNWGFGQDRQEKKCGFELNTSPDVVGQYVLNESGGRPLLGGQEERGGVEGGEVPYRHGRSGSPAKGRAISNGVNGKFYLTVGRVRRRGKSDIY